MPTVLSKTYDGQSCYMTPMEKRLARLWHEEDQVAVEEIGRRLRRDQSTIWRNLSGEFDGDSRSRTQASAH